MCKHAVLPCCTSLLLKFDAQFLFLIKLVILISEEDRALYELFINKRHSALSISVYDIAILPDDTIASTLHLEIYSDKGPIWLGLREQGRR